MDDLLDELPQSFGPRYWAPTERMMVLTALMWPYW
jgi:hypothetical protein